MPVVNYRPNNTVLSQELMRQQSYDPRNRRIDALTDIAQQQHGYGAGLTGVLAKMLGAYGAKRQQKKLDDKYEGEELQQRDALAQALKDEQEHQIPGEVDPMAVTLAGQSVPGLQGMANPMVAQLLSAGRDVERADLGAKNDAIRAENSNKADLRALVDAGVDRSAILGIRENRRADDLRYKRGLEGEDRALGQAKELAEFEANLPGKGYNRQTVTLADGVYSIDPRDPNADPVRIGDAPGKKGSEPPEILRIAEWLHPNDPEAARTFVAEAKGPKEGGGKQQFDFADKLRDEFVSQTKDFVKVRDSYGRIQAAAKDPSAAGDLALIFNYMKLLDPGSVVRESEYATAQNAAGIPDRVRSMYNRILSGEKLAETQREDFVGRSSGLYQSQFDRYNQTVQQYEGLSERFNVDPRNVIVDMDPRFADGTGSSFKYLGTE